MIIKEKKPIFIIDLDKTNMAENENLREQKKNRLEALYSLLGKDILKNEFRNNE